MAHRPLQENLCRVCDEKILGCFSRSNNTELEQQASSSLSLYVSYYLLSHLSLIPPRALRSIKDYYLIGIAQGSCRQRSSQSWLRRRRFMLQHTKKRKAKKENDDEEENKMNVEKEAYRAPASEYCTPPFSSLKVWFRESFFSCYPIALPRQIIPSSSLFYPFKARKKVWRVWKVKRQPLSTEEAREFVIPGERTHFLSRLLLNALLSNVSLPERIKHPATAFLFYNTGYQF